MIKFIFLFFNTTFLGRWGKKNRKLFALNDEAIKNSSFAEKKCDYSYQKQQLLRVNLEHGLGKK
jgi:hypothetical protein